MSYEILAEFYDQLMNEIDYSEWLNYLETITFADSLQHINSRAPGTENRTQLTVLDLACGTGPITLELAHRGYNVQALDISPEMLAVADSKLFSAGYNVELTQQNMESFIVREPVDWVVCCFDSINYLEGIENVEKTFSQVYKSLKPGGYFTFDLHSEYKLEHFFGNNTFASSDSELSYIWENYFDHEIKAVTMDLTFFIPERDGTYTRLEETHVEYYHDIQSVTALLQKIGFTLVSILSDLTLEPPNEKTERIFIVAKKNA